MSETLGGTVLLSKLSVILNSLSCQLQCFALHIREHLAHPSGCMHEPGTEYILSGLSGFGVHTALVLWFYLFRLSNEFIEHCFEI